MRQARSVAQATSSLVNAIKGEALDHTDGDMQKRLLGAAQALADATYRMVEAAKVSVSFLCATSHLMHITKALHSHQMKYNGVRLLLEVHSR